MEKCNYIRIGFTLAEVLIVVGIIGLIAVLTIQPIINSTQETELISLYKKAYSLLSEAYTSAVNENQVGFGEWDPITTTTSAVSYTKFFALKSKLKVIKECPYGTGSKGNCWAKNGVGQYNVSLAGPHAINWSNTNTRQNMNESFVTADGMYLMLSCTDATRARDAFAVDINGEKKPNDWGKDVFIFTFDDASLIPGTGTSASIKHNDGSFVSYSEWTAPLLK